MDHFRDLVIPCIFRNKLYLLSRVSMAFALKAISYLPISTVDFQFPHSYVERNEESRNALFDANPQGFNNQIFLFKMAEAVTVF